MITLALTCFTCHRNLPLSVHSALCPVVNRGVCNPVNRTMSMFTVLNALFKLTADLNVSISRVGANLGCLIPDVPIGAAIRIVTVALVANLTLVSMLTNVSGKMGELSVLGVVLTAALVLFIFVINPSMFVLGTFVRGANDCLNGVIRHAFDLRTCRRKS